MVELGHILQLGGHESHTLVVWLMTYLEVHLVQKVELIQKVQKEEQGSHVLVILFYEKL